jgi:hypothetical protein
MDEFEKTFTDLKEKRYDEIPISCIDEIKDRYNSDNERGDTDLKNYLQILEDHYHNPSYKMKVKSPGLPSELIDKDRVVLKKDIFEGSKRKEEIFKVIEKIDVYTVSKKKLFNNPYFDYETVTPVNLSFSHLYDRKIGNPGKERPKIKEYIKPYIVMPSKPKHQGVLSLALPQGIVDYFNFNTNDSPIRWKVGIIEDSTDEILLVPFQCGSVFSILESSIINEKFSGEIDTYFQRIKFFKEPVKVKINDNSYKVILTPLKYLFEYTEFEKAYTDMTLSEFPPYALYVDFFGQIHLQRMALIPEKYHDRSKYRYIPNSILSQIFSEAQSVNKQISYEEVLQKTNFSHYGIDNNDIESYMP